MSASGKSSNRKREAYRGLETGTGHGIYAAEGKRQFQNPFRRCGPLGIHHFQPIECRHWKWWNCGCRECTDCGLTETPSKSYYR